jgi:hypothetical protein
MTFITEKRDKLSRGWFVIFGVVVAVMIGVVVLAARGALDPPLPSPAPAAAVAPAAMPARVPVAPPTTMAATVSEECQRMGLGKSERDILGARAICAVVEPAGWLDQIQLIRVEDSIATLNITRPLYVTLAADRVSAQAQVASMLDSLRRTSGGDAVTLWIYSDRVRVIEGDSSGGEPRVKFLAD